MYRFAAVLALAGPNATASCSVVLARLAAAGSDAFGQQYPFLPVPGSPKSVKSLFQDSRGRLWLGGEQPACFDGTRFFFLREYGSRWPGLTASARTRAGRSGPAPKPVYIDLRTVVLRKSAQGWRYTGITQLRSQYNFQTRSALQRG
jgi:hypothetical protein